ncbi:hypothetical protein D029_0080 [Vibrio parahaemolyticus 970107]|nr:hypothetical protein D029_0080 [Vibrio parahaemolyticus 970107]
MFYGRLTVNTQQLSVVWLFSSIKSYRFFNSISLIKNGNNINRQKYQ